MVEVQSEAAIAPSYKLAEAILESFGADVNMCFQCGKCGAGCPIAFAMDYTPSQLIHAAQLGLNDLILGSKTIWLCAACETCTTRCPQGVDIAKVMDAAKIIAVQEKVEPAVGPVRSFHQAAVASIRHFGRMWEVGMIASLKLRTGDYFKDLELGKRMMCKRKLKLIPSFTGSRRAGKIFARVRKAEKQKSWRR